MKDIFDTVDFPTSYGSPIYAGHRPKTDAAMVMVVRRAGGVILGKTVTTEFASLQPAGTRNPHNPAHTPGGSSSGSAAAVAAREVPVALGSQTVGSILRPAAYNGVVGRKFQSGDWGTRISGLSVPVQVRSLAADGRGDGVAQAGA